MVSKYLSTYPNQLVLKYELPLMVNIMFINNVKIIRNNPDLKQNNHLAKAVLWLFMSDLENVMKYES